MLKIIYTLIVSFYINAALSQAFITIDNDTNEFIEDVNYSLFCKKKQVFNGLTQNKKITFITTEMEYDSISFSRIDYSTLGFQKKNLDSIVLLTKKIVYLDEVVIGSEKNNYLLIGETNRFVKKQSRPIAEDIYFGIIHKNEFANDVEIKKIVFFTDKIYYKTAYKISFYEVTETLPNRGNQYADIGNLIFSTDTLYIDKKNKNKEEVAINSELLLKQFKSVFISIQLLYYLDSNDKIINSVTENRTKLKFQLSNKTNFYSTTVDLFSKKRSSKLMNMNLLVNYDFANEFFLKPHKSILVAPAIILYAKGI